MADWSLEANERGRFREDAFLRRPMFGFVIYSRPKRGVALWRDSAWNIYTHEEAMELARDIMKARGKMLQESVATGDKYV